MDVSWACRGRVVGVSRACRGRFAVCFDRKSAISRSISVDARTGASSKECSIFFMLDITSRVDSSVKGPMSASTLQ